MTDRTKERTELIQSAAVIVSIIEDMDEGQAKISEHTNSILVEIMDERRQQDEKWGPQHHPAYTWAMILAEEVGEYAEELDKHFDRTGSVVECIAHGMISMGQLAKQWLEENDLG